MVGSTLNIVQFGPHCERLALERNFSVEFWKEIVSGIVGTKSSLLDKHAEEGLIRKPFQILLKRSQVACVNSGIFMLVCCIQ